MIRTALFACLLALPGLIAAPAAAQDALDRATAKRQLFDGRRSELVIRPQPFLSDLDMATLREMPKLAQLDYYGALAAAPGLGFQAEATRGAFNYHTPDAARAAAMRDCNAVRGGGPACVVVAEIWPVNYETGRALTLSQAATRAVAGRDYRRAGRNAALAISPSTGAWGLGSGAAAALATCGAVDCALVVAE